MRDVRRSNRVTQDLNALLGGRSAFLPFVRSPFTPVRPTE